jgi:hypothetical protein
MYEAITWSEWLGDSGALHCSAGSGQLLLQLLASAAISNRTAEAALFMHTL